MILIQDEGHSGVNRKRIVGHGGRAPSFGLGFLENLEGEGLGVIKFEIASTYLAYPDFENCSRGIIGRLSPIVPDQRVCGLFCEKVQNNREVTLGRRVH